MTKVYHSPEETAAINDENDRLCNLPPAQQLPYIDPITVDLDVVFPLPKDDQHESAREDSSGDKSKSTGVPDEAGPIDPYARKSPYGKR